MFFVKSIICHGLTYDLVTLLPRSPTLRLRSARFHYDLATHSVTRSLRPIRSCHADITTSKISSRSYRALTRALIYAVYYLKITFQNSYKLQGNAYVGSNGVPVTPAHLLCFNQVDLFSPKAWNHVVVVILVVHHGILNSRVADPHQVMKADTGFHDHSYSLWTLLHS